MNIKKYIYMMAAMAGIATLASCDHIDQDDRYIELPKVEAKRVVILEEFTGQNCVNCPEAHEVVSQLLQQYPENLISVSFHAGPLAMSEDKFPGVGLGTATGEAYYSAYSISSVPSGVVNRTSGVLTKDGWAASIRDAMAKPSNLDMDVKAALTDDGKSIEVTTNFSPYDNIKANLLVWVVESGIKGLQLTPAGYVADYEHNHVFRTSANGQDGEAVTLTVNIPHTVTTTVPVQDGWIADNISIVAFVYDSKGVLQAAQCHLAQ